jgi:hypothetical protein
MRRGFGWMTGLAMTFAVACSGSVTEPVDLHLAATDADPSGTFNLFVVNNATLPIFSFQTATADWTLVSQKFTLGTGGSWTDSSHYSVQSVNTGTIADSTVVGAGQYTIGSGRITFNPAPSGDAFQGSVTGAVFTIIFNNERWVYKRATQ